MRRRKSTKKRELTEEESLEILKAIVHDPILNFKNHRKHNLKPNVFRFTVDLLSVELVITLLEHEKINNVYYNASIPPPGGSLDSISMRYKIYVEYHFLVDK